VASGDRWPRRLRVGHGVVLCEAARVFLGVAQWTRHVGTCSGQWTDRVTQGTAAMGLISMMIDVLAVSAGAAAVRRGTGYSAKEWVCSRLPSLPLRGLAASYFNVGEALVFSVVKYAAVLRSGRESRLRESEGGEDAHGDRRRPHEPERDHGRPHDEHRDGPPRDREPPRDDRQYRKD
jgi:hypothetical protein